MRLFFVSVVLMAIGSASNADVGPWQTLFEGKSFDG